MTRRVPADVLRRVARAGILPGIRADHAGPSGSARRCRKPMRAYEVREIPAPSGTPAACGRPEGHGGQCYSEVAWRRKLEANAAGVLAARAREAAARENRDAA